MSSELHLPITGSRVIIRRPGERDLEPWYDLEANACVKRYLGGPVTTLRDEWITGMRATLANHRMLAIEDRLSTSFVGRATLDVNKTWNLEIVIGRDYWGRRYGRELGELLVEAAFAYLNAPILVAVVHPENKASRRLVRKLGFLRSGMKDIGGWGDVGHLIFRLGRRRHANFMQRHPPQKPSVDRGPDYR